MEVEKDYYVSDYDTHCLEHGRQGVFLLKLNYGGVLIPMCQECLDDLYQELGKFATKKA